MEIVKGNNVIIGNSVTFNAKKIILGNNVIIGDNVKIKCLDTFEIGDFSIIASNVTISCNNFKSGKWLYTCSGFEVGRGGCFNKDSNVTIGDHVGIFENVILNPNSEIYIGDNCGIGAEVMVWTHGAWLNPLEGFPKDFGPVSIGKNVWLPARSIVLPNVTIGNNVVIGTNSLVNKNIPAGCLAVGMPIKIIKENYYPKNLTITEKNSILEDIINNWKNLIQFKGIEIQNITLKDCIITLSYNDQTTIFDTINKTINGNINTISEDFRDYLRRNGIKIYTDRHFKSI